MRSVARDPRSAFNAAVREVPIESGTWQVHSPHWIQGHADPGGRFGFDEAATYHLDGISWHDAPPPPASHSHWVQTYGYHGFNQVFRCPCGAIGGNMDPRWSLLDPPRVRPTLAARLAKSMGRGAA